MGWVVGCVRAAAVCLVCPRAHPRACLREDPRTSRYLSTSSMRLPAAHSSHNTVFSKPPCAARALGVNRLVPCRGAVRGVGRACIRGGAAGDSFPSVATGSWVLRCSLSLFWPRSPAPGRTGGAGHESLGAGAGPLQKKARGSVRAVAHFSRLMTKFVRHSHQTRAERRPGASTTNRPRARTGQPHGANASSPCLGVCTPSSAAAT
jgi:hypothetical protein